MDPSPRLASRGGGAQVSRRRPMDGSHQEHRDSHRTAAETPRCSGQRQAMYTHTHRQLTASEQIRSGEPLKPKIHCTIDIISARQGRHSDDMQININDRTTNLRGPLRSLLRKNSLSGLGLRLRLDSHDSSTPLLAVLIKPVIEVGLQLNP